MSLWESVDVHFRCGDVAGAVLLLERFISTQKAQEFACLPSARFSNAPESIVAELNRFVLENERSFDVKAIYLEMNGFDINCDRWYFDLFAYSTYSPDPDNVEWLCEWQSGRWPEVELLGMPEAQAAFAWYHEHRIWKSQPEFKPTYEAAMLLVVSKFAALIGSALKDCGLVKKIPVLATAHDFESIARYERRTRAESRSGA